VLLLPLDYLSWTEPVAAAATELAARSQKELGAAGLEMRITGRASERARTELQSLGWAVKENAPSGSPVSR
jgi:hypothetical protein